MKRPAMSEEQLAARVVAWLKDVGFEVFQEVEPRGWGSGRADIVARRAGELVVVEAKLALSFELLSQAVRWIPYSSAVYIAVATARRSPGRIMALQVVKSLELGALEVESLWPTEERVRTGVSAAVAPITRKSFSPRLLEELSEEHKTHARAGTNRGGQWTRFKQTCAALAVYALANPGDELRRALAFSDHHYSSIGNAIAKLTKIDPADLAKLGIRIDVVDGVARLYAIEEQLREAAS